MVNGIRKLTQHSVHHPNTRGLNDIYASWLYKQTFNEDSATCFFFRRIKFKKKKKLYFNVLITCIVPLYRLLYNTGMIIAVTNFGLFQEFHISKSDVMIVDYLNFSI